jgi:hypothetical protein
MELIVASGISVMIASVMIIVFAMVLDTYTRMVRQYEAESEMVSAMFALKTTLATSQSMTLLGNAATSESGFNHNAVTDRGGAATDVTRGYLAANFQNTSTAGDLRLIAMGVRDINVVGNTSDFQAFGVYYQTQTVARSGALIIDTESNNAGGWTRLSPVNAPQMYTRFTSFLVTNIDVINADGSFTKVTTSALATAHRSKSVVAADFTLEMRYFTKGRALDYKWCPNAAMAACGGVNSNTMGNFYNVQKVMRVVFANNNYQPTKYLSARPFGNLYLFKFAAGKAR